MRKTGLFVFSALLTVAGLAIASEPALPGLLRPAVDDPISGTTYRCYTIPSPPRCYVLYQDGTQASVESAIETVDWPTYLAAMRAFRTGAATPVLAAGDEGLIAACANTHGGSACCRIVARHPLLGTVDIECG